MHNAQMSQMRFADDQEVLTDIAKEMARLRDADGRIAVSATGESIHGHLSQQCALDSCPECGATLERAA